MRRALALALEVAAASAGLFDPTVQALWEAHVDWFSARRMTACRPARAIASARDDGRLAAHRAVGRLESASAAASASPSTASAKVM
jgi:thiamine biosynthesis lipoprotein ApbE